jgi:nicotinate dehydrogenase subunit B
MNPFDVEQEDPSAWGFVQTVDRREFLRLTGTGLLVAYVVDGLFGRVDVSAFQGGRGGGPPADVNAYLHIGVNGRVTCLVGKVEMGQGAMTSLPQLAAEELDVPLASVDVVMGDTDLCPYDAGTWGSLSIRQFGPALRAAAAEARTVLLQMAAERFQVPVGELTVDAGTIIHKNNPERRVTYGQLTEGKRIERKLEGRPTLEAVSAFTIVGKTAPRRDSIDKVTGKAKYAGDIAPPNALYARILRPPAHPANSALQSVDTSAAEKVPGVRVVRDRDLVAVLHAHRDEADKALRLVKATWAPSPSTLTDESIFDHLVKTSAPGNPAAPVGDLATGQGLATQLFDETYRKGYVAHAPMEPHTAVAAVEKGKVTVWAGTQSPFGLKNQLMSALALPAEQVRVITPYIGGGFGGKSAHEQGVEAARLAIAAGVPVRVIWSREEEFFYDTFDPAAVLTIRSGIDANKKIVFWDYTVHGAGGRGAAHFYAIPHHRTQVRGNAQGLHPFATGPWRAPGANANAFARESQIDIMAARAGMDPVEFRLHNLTDARMRRVLDAAVKAWGWTPKPGPSGRGYGVALGTDAGTYCVNMAEVKVDKATGQITVVRLLAVQDMGVVVNPEGATQQMEGCLTMGMGYALAEDVHFKNGVIADTNFDTYRLPRFSWLPKIETVILDTPDLPAQGGGEPAIVQMGGVLANAVFDACGARVRQLPMTPARVLAALRG